MLNKVVKKITPPKAGAGRPKGSLNKTTMACKDALTFAFDGIGGAERLVAWVKQDEKNESAFWTSIYPKLLPLQVTGDPSSPIHVVIAPNLEKIRSVIGKIAG
jgi:hypothetical protein